MINNFNSLLYLSVEKFMKMQLSPVNSPHKGQWRGALVFSLICVWIDDWVNNREAGDLRRYRAHYDVIVMIFTILNRVQKLIWNRISDIRVSSYDVDLVHFTNIMDKCINASHIWAFEVYCHCLFIVVLESTVKKSHWYPIKMGLATSWNSFPQK